MPPANTPRSRSSSTSPTEEPGSGFSGMPARRLQVLFLTRWYPTAAAPVVAPFTRDHALAAALHADVLVLHADAARSWTPATCRLECEADPGVHQGVPTYRVHSRRRAKTPLEQALSLAHTLRAVREIRSGGFRPDLVHGHFHDSAVASALAARLLGVPFVLTLHSIQRGTGALARAERLAARAACRRARCVMPVSRALRSALEASGSRARFAVVPNVVDLAWFRPAPRPAAAPPPVPGLASPPVQRLIAVTRMTGIKGIDTLLAAAARLRAHRRDWHLDLVGGGERSEEYRRLAGGLGLGGCTTFHGELERRDVAARLRRATLFVLASERETFSVATLEALACGVPVVVTSCGGPEELVDGAAGLVVPPRDPDALCQAIDRMLDLAGGVDRAAIAAAAASRFSAAAVGRQILEVYRRALAPPDSER
jgi:glycosyltransferase involved in cell wall biosynthesis